MGHGTPHESDYERSDVSGSVMVLVSCGLASLLLLAPLLLALFYPSAIHQAHVKPVPNPPAPRLQIDPPADLAALRATEAVQLSSYGWEDRAAGIVRIPIDRAVRLTAERGLAGWRRP